MDKSEKKFPPPPRDCPSSNPTASTTRHRTPPLPQLPWWNPMPLPQGLVSAQAAPPHAHPTHSTRCSSLSPLESCFGASPYLGPGHMLNSSSRAHGKCSFWSGERQLRGNWGEVRLARLQYLRLGMYMFFP